MKIYDCFIFFNELPLLEVRLHELYEIVHRFVLVESPVTHQGNPKPLYYADNKKRFEQFNDKIVHVIEDCHDTANSAWAREMAQRNRISKEIGTADDNDLILVSDLDEIARASSLVDISSRLAIKPVLTFLRLRFYYYFMNYEFTDLSWSRASIAPYGLLKDQDLSWVRYNFASLPHIVPVLGKLTLVPRTSFSPEDSQEERVAQMRCNTHGWHFSYVGGIDAIIEKFRSFSHMEYNNDKFCNRDFIYAAIDQKIGLGGNQCCEVVPIDETYPKFVRDNLEQFKQKGFIKL